MRLACVPCALIAMLALASHSTAQEKKQPYLRIDGVRVGFRPYNVNEVHLPYKAGHWAPVVIAVKAGEFGVKQGQVILETPDSETIGTRNGFQFALAPEETRNLVGYINPGNVGAEIGIDINADGRNYERKAGNQALPLGAQQILTLGARIPELYAALLKSANRRQGEEQADSTWPRFASYETDATLLPIHGYGYGGVDMIVLAGDNKEFVQHLLQEPEQLKLAALAQWVRGGGHLVIAFSWIGQPEVAQLLKSPVWQPRFPVPIPDSAGDVKASPVASLFEFQDWARSQSEFSSQTLKPAQPIYLGLLRDKNAADADWDVLAYVDKDKDRRPVMARMPYGLGSIALVGLALDKAPFTTWKGAGDFWTALIQRSLPRPPQGMLWDEQRQQNDVVTNLTASLDNFDIRVIPFGWVALFILLYILVVGPLDYFLLKHVFGRLEWTWITFPTVVIAVSVAAYFTAYAIKGNDLKINQIDVVDIDLRTSIDAQQKPKGAYLRGTSVFTLLSPRIQNYTIGIEPNPVFWGQPRDKPLSAFELSWLGRADSNFGGMGNRSSQSFFRRPYQHVSDGAALKDVPIAVWSTKSFQAEWEHFMPQSPIEVDLQYYLKPERGQDLRIAGSIRSNLPDVFDELFLFYRDRYYPVSGSLEAGKEIKIALEPRHAVEIPRWLNEQKQNLKGIGPDEDPARERIGYDPVNALKPALFNERLSVGNSPRNHSLSRLDLSWRLPEDNKIRDTSLREAVLVGRTRARSGPAETLTRDDQQPLPTLLWLGDYPTPEKTRPSLSGSLNQDTIIRIIVPVRPAQR